MKYFLWLPLVLPVTGCAALDTTGGRIGLLVLLPAALLIGVLWSLARRRREGSGARRRENRRFPDYDDRD